MSGPAKDYEVRGDMVVIPCPVVRTGTAALNRALFTKTIGVAAAALEHNKFIAKYRKSLEHGKEILSVTRISPIQPHPDTSLASQGRKCLLLEPGVRPSDPSTWGPILKTGVENQELTVIPYEVQFDYDYWTYRDVMASILPEELHDEIPTGFNIAGHVAHLNLRDNYLPYKHLAAEIILDKNPQIKTVINKVDNVGSESEFRTFQYEVLAGPDDLNVRVSESDCIFEFDYSKVYWNSKLEAEHSRLIDLFRPGEVVCDVMAGIGPFAVPAGKKRVFVWANDKNPESAKYLQAAITKNKVSPFVRPFCEDGHAFIHQAADSVFEASQNGEYAVLPPKKKKRTSPTPAAASSGAKEPNEAQPPAQEPEPERIPIPPTISHFVMNLPASAIEFLSNYRGLYAGREHLFAPAQATEETPGTQLPRLPIVHAHCFSFKATDETPTRDVCERVSKELGFPVRPAPASLENIEELEEGMVKVYYVRDVAPAKSMYCASFRLPREVAFAPRG